MDSEQPENPAGTHFVRDGDVGQQHELLHELMGGIRRDTRDACHFQRTAAAQDAELRRFQRQELLLLLSSAADGLRKGAQMAQQVQDAFLYLRLRLSCKETLNFIEIKTLCDGHDTVDAPCLKNFTCLFVDCQQDAVRKAFFAFAEAAEIRRKNRRQHGKRPAGQVGREAAFEGFLVQRRINRDIAGDIRDMDADNRRARPWAGLVREGVVIVLRVHGIDGHKRPLREILPWKFQRDNVFQLLVIRDRVVFRKVVFLHDGVESADDGAAFGQPFDDFRLQGGARRPSADEAGQHPVAFARAFAGVHVVVVPKQRNARRQFAAERADFKAFVAQPQAADEFFMGAFENLADEADGAARIVAVDDFDENGIVRNGAVQAVWRDENIAGRRAVLRRDETETLGVDTDGAADKRKRLPRDETAAVFFHDGAVGHQGFEGLLEESLVLAAETTPDIRPPEACFRRR